MTPSSLTEWRARLGLTQAKAANALGISTRGYAIYERGYVDVSDGAGGVERRWRPIPRHIALACAAIEREISPLP